MRRGPSPSSDSGADAARSQVDYSDPTNWVCGTNASHDHCRDSQTVTEFHADGTQTTSTISGASSAALDCFYVYPTVDVADPAGNVENFDNLADILDPVMAQAAPFAQACTVYAPFYHQATFGSYLDANLQKYLEVAYADVANAFRYYLAHLNHGRKFVLFGHSQGAHMLRRLIQREVEPNSGVLSQMELAMLIGSLGDFVVPPGAAVGGSFQKVPLCNSPNQAGCVISFNTYPVRHGPQSALLNSDTTKVGPCVNPGLIGAAGKATFASSLFPTKVHNALFDPHYDFGVTTNFAEYDAAFTGACKSGPAGLDYLEIDSTSDAGVAPIPIDRPVLTNLGDAGATLPFDAALYAQGAPVDIGFHLLDFTFPMHELIAAVTTRAP